ncbi:MAG: DNRLRE domain-containing protein [Bacteroidetes bacterium]|nr:DNRLRE domain-containing protein [Bacteroidota bacterium]
MVSKNTTNSALFLVVCLLFPAVLHAQWVEEVLVPATEDATVSSLDSSANYGDNPDLIALAWSANDRDFVLRSLMRFELPELAEGEILLGATLSLFATTGSTNPNHLGFNDALITRINGSWTPNDVTWQNQPPVVTDHAVFLPRSDAPDQDFTNLDVTGLVSDMLNETGTAPQGLMIQLQSESVFRSINFASSDHPDASRHPLLTLNIQRVGSTGFGSVVQPADLQVAFGPNPLQDQLSLTLQVKSAQSATLEVYDASGRMLEQRNLGKLSSGETALLLPAAAWPSGSLLFRVVLDNGAASPMRPLLKP